MPVTFTGTRLAWIDLDLDYRVHLDNSVEALDEEECAENAQRMQYPAALVGQAQAACQEVEAGLRRGLYPFNYARQVEVYQLIKREMLGNVY